MSPLPVGVVSFLFTDVEGSTRLLRTLGPRYGELLAEHNRIIREAIDRHGGVEVRTEGDAFFCAFANPSAALNAALEAQRELHAHRWPEDARLSSRMGLHTGEAELGGDDYISLAVHQASRVADSGHGGQVVVSEATVRLVGDKLPHDVELAALGCFRLRDFPEPTRLFELRHPDLPAGFPALRALPAAAHNVPEPATVFVGRAAALKELSELVTARRLVSIVGAGGVGKTRLATEVVPLVTERFDDGVWMVELACLQKGDAVVPEVATILGIRAEAGRDIHGTVASALAAKRMLLVLDNCEHVLDTVAGLVEQLLRHCPTVQVLTTTREPLGLPAERRYPLAPLGISGHGGDAAASEAVALFVERARVVSPGFDLGREQQAVVDICRRLDGLPLAIELAAARIASIPPARIAQRLDRRFSVLKHSYRGSLPHHATLHASIEWSFDLLQDDERVLLRRLGAFTGAFDLEAAEAICGYAPLEVDAVLDLLGCLVDKSLVQRSDDRYTLLETIREFAREQLESAAEGDELAERHLAHYVELVETAAAQAQGPGQREAYDRLDAELPDIRAAVELSIERSRPAALRLSAALGQYGFVRNRLGEVSRWCIEAAAAAPDSQPALRARALSQAGFARLVMGAPQDGQVLMEQALALARSSGETALLIDTLLMAADLRLETGQPEAARPHVEEALALIPPDAPGLAGRATLLAAAANRDHAGYEPTHLRLGEALALFERAGDRRQVGRVLMNMAYLSLEVGELAIADREAARCVAVAEELEHPIGEAAARLVQMWVRLESGDVSNARTLLAKAAGIACESGYVTLLSYCAAARAGVQVAEGDDAGAARTLGALRGAAARLGDEPERAIAERVESLTQGVRSRLGENAVEALMREGMGLTLEAVAAMPV